MWSSYRAHSELCFHLKKSKKKKTKNTVELHLNNKNQEQLHLQNAMQPLSICKSLSTIKKKQQTFQKNDKRELIILGYIW